MEPTTGPSATCVYVSERSSGDIAARAVHDESDVSRKASNVEFDGYCQKGQAVESLVDMLEQLFA